MAGSDSPNAASAWRPSYNPWLIAVAVMLATFMEVLDTSVANVSLPHIAGNLSATTDEATWVLTSYLVANAIILPATNWLGNLFGRKRFLVSCIVLFTLASALCGAAGSLGFLVIARVLQGAAGGALQPISQAVLLESFPPKKRGSAMAVFAMGVVVAPILGPTLGGWITDNYSWRWVFYINLPIGLLAALMANAVIEDPPYLKRVDASSIDYLGFGFLALWLATLQFVLDKGQELDWFGSHTIAWCLTISTVAFVAFVVRELTASRPLVDLRVLKNRNLAVGCALIAILGALLYGTIAVLPLFMQNLLHYTALDAGLALSPRGVGAFMATILVGRLVGKISNRILITIGFLGLAYSSFLFGNINLSIGMSSIVWPTVLSGVAISFIFVPLATSAMGTLEQDQIGNASGLFNLMRNLGGSVGIAGLTTFVARGAQSNQAAFVSHFSQYNPVYQQKLAAIQHGLAMHEGAWRAAQQAPQVLYGILGQQSLLVTYAHNFRLFGILCLLTTPLVFFFKKVRKGKAPAGLH
ncbi:MAG TPA: DHA2 family efflux MFS transporter permease subunit [Chthoniobacterales bacterium]|nr:DHA2 family efflux MFS transporter permease subunit [Chthoniobacterales bacterium]